jgi:membrane associated rhomboid family serine protease
MSNEKVLVLDRSRTLFIMRFVFLIGIATIVPLFHQQMITGPIVNATLFAATILLGTTGGIFVGLIPSLIALSVGTLPAALAPMIPYIMLSNAILVLTFSFLKERNYWLAIGVSSFLKFIFLFSSSSLVINLLLRKELAQSVASMMSWPQLVTALLGGGLAWIILRRKDF